MIVLNSTKINSKFHKKLKKYQKILNYGSLECPVCHSKEYMKWGFYERGVTYFKNNTLFSEIVKIQRIRCKSCGKTHALLLFGITPYKQLADEVLLSILLNEATTKYFAEETVQYYNKQYLKYHYPNLATMLKIRDKLKLLYMIKDQKEEILRRYIQMYKKCFMQIKLSYLGYAPS